MTEFETRISGLSLQTNLLCKRQKNRQTHRVTYGGGSTTQKVRHIKTNNFSKLLDLFKYSYFVKIVPLYYNYDIGKMDLQFKQSQCS